MIASPADTGFGNPDDPARVCLSDHVRAALIEYLEQLDGHPPANLYELVMQEVERPLLEIVMEHAAGNQSKAARCLGINRTTLRKKLCLHGLSP